MWLPVGDRSLAGKSAGFGCLRENYGNHTALLFSLVGKVRDICTGASHPMLPLPFPLWKHTCFWRCPVSYMISNCNRFFGNLEMEVCSFIQNWFVCCSFTQACLCEYKRVYAREKWITHYKNAILNALCASKFFAWAQVQTSIHKGLSATKLSHLHSYRMDFWI